MNSVDITFIGHMCYDEIVPYQGETRISPGSAVLCGAMAAVRTGRKIGVVTKMSPDDDAILDPMREQGIGIYVVPAYETTYSKVVHPTEDVDVREIYALRSAGLFNLVEISPNLKSTCVHLAGITDQEFDLPFIEGLKKRNYSLSVDMQSFVRQVDSQTKQVFFKDVPQKKKIVSMMDKVKLDIVEAEILTGTRDLESAAKEVSSWGCPEVMITNSEGVLTRVNGNTFYEAFTNRSIVGRTGRGDTTFAAYLSWRLDHSPVEALKFAAALVSIKMETPGPFNGSLEDVLLRLQNQK